MSNNLKTRLITGFSAAILAISALVFLESPLMGILVILFSSMACYETCHVAEMKNKAMIAVAVIVAAALPPLLEYDVFGWLNLPVFLPLLGYFFLLVILMLAGFEKTKFIHMLFALVGSLAVPGAISSVFLVRDMMRENERLWEKNLVIFFIFYVFCCAWLTDIFAFAVGINFGKRKLCPKVSPKKTVEGAIGGLVLTAVANGGVALMFNRLFLVNHQIKLQMVFAMSFLLSAAAMLGDLTASVCKRNFGAKDFGKLFPGHGGVMDRFDSLLFVAPLALGLLQLQYQYGWELFSEVIG